MLKRLLSLASLFVVAIAASPGTAAPPMKALIIDGQNNHRNWPQTTPMMKGYLEDTGAVLR